MPVTTRAGALKSQSGDNVAPSLAQATSNVETARKHRIPKKIHLLQSNKRSLFETLMSLGYLVGEPVCRGRKGKKKKNNVSSSDSSCSSSKLSSDQD